MSENDLINSRRLFDRLSYSPLILPKPDDDEPTDALGLAAMVRSLELTSAELDQLEPGATTAVQRGALAAIRGLTDATTGSTSLAATEQLARVSTTTLQWFGKALGELRERVGEKARNGLLAIDQQMSAHQQQASQQQPTAPPLLLSQFSATTNVPRLARNAGVGDRPLASYFAAARVETPLSGGSAATSAQSFPSVAGVAPVIAARIGADLGARIDSVASWGLSN